MAYRNRLAGLGLSVAHATGETPQAAQEGIGLKPGPGFPQLIRIPDAALPPPVRRVDQEPGSNPYSYGDAWRVWKPGPDHEIVTIERVYGNAGPWPRYNDQGRFELTPGSVGFGTGISMRPPLTRFLVRGLVIWEKPAEILTLEDLNKTEVVPFDRPHFVGWGRTPPVPMEGAGIGDIPHGTCIETVAFTSGAFLYVEGWKVVDCGLQVRGPFQVQGKPLRSLGYYPGEPAQPLPIGYKQDAGPLPGIRFDIKPIRIEQELYEPGDPLPGHSVRKASKPGFVSQSWVPTWIKRSYAYLRTGSMEYGRQLPRSLPHDAQGIPWTLPEQSPDPTEGGDPDAPPLPPELGPRPEGEDPYACDETGGWYPEDGPPCPWTEDLDIPPPFRPTDPRYRHTDDPNAPSCDDPFRNTLAPCNPEREYPYPPPEPDPEPPVEPEPPGNGGHGGGSDGGNGGGGGGGGGGDGGGGNGDGGGPPGGPGPDSGPAGLEPAWWLAGAAGLLLLIGQRRRD